LLPAVFSRARVRADRRRAPAQIYAWLSAHDAITAKARIRAESNGIDRNPDAGTCLAGAAVTLGAIIEVSADASLVQLVCQTLFDVLYTLRAFDRPRLSPSLRPNVDNLQRHVRESRAEPNNLPIP